jgi:hypothetical protein
MEADLPGGANPDPSKAAVSVVGEPRRRLTLLRSACSTLKRSRRATPTTTIRATYSTPLGRTKALTRVVSNQLR